MPDGTTDFDIKDKFANGIYLRAIHFVGSVGTDKLYVRDKTVTGALLTPTPLQDGDTYLEILPKRRFPYIDASECTFGTPAGCMITIYFD